LLNFIPKKPFLKNNLRSNLLIGSALQIAVLTGTMTIHWSLQKNNMTLKNTQHSEQQHYLQLHKKIQSLQQCHRHSISIKTLQHKRAALKKNSELAANMEIITSNLPQDSILNQINATANSITVEGYAASSNSISCFIRNLKNSKKLKNIFLENIADITQKNNVSTVFTIEANTVESAH
jgi:Tfp pilus assembly protein PilN